MTDRMKGRREARGVERERGADQEEKTERGGPGREEGAKELRGGGGGAEEELCGGADVGEGRGGIQVCVAEESLEGKR